MRLLFDTHCAIWAVYSAARFPDAVKEVVEAASTKLYFSAVGIAEIAIKRAQNRADFPFEPEEVRRELVGVGYVELPLTGQHARHLRTMPTYHRDPFDRLLIAQAIEEGLTMLTADATISTYPIPVLRI